MHRVLLFIASIAALLPSTALATEHVRSEFELIAEGYAPSEPANLIARFEDRLPRAHTLPWPVTFQDTSHALANVMAQFQPFSHPPYYHGGCDLRVSEEAEVRAPVSGRLEAGHYGYATQPDGSMIKYWKPWPQSGDSAYFEVAVVSDDGIRYELHHVERSSLPAGIVAILNSGGGRVAAGELLGRTYYWPDGEYHHIHYNIILPSGVRVNPEFVSPLLPDRLAPEIQAVFAVMSDGSVRQYKGGRLAQMPSEFVLAVIDRQDESVYEHPPSFARLRFETGAETSWDFRQSLVGNDGRFPPIWDFFVKNIVAPSGQNYSTDGGYGVGLSLVRLKVPKGAAGRFEMVVGDIAGNISSFSGRLKPMSAASESD